MSSIGDVIDSATGFFEGDDSESTTSTSSVSPLKGRNRKIYNKFYNQLQKLYGNMQGLQGVKEDAYADLKSAMGGYGGAYQDTISSLIDDISSGDKDLSFSLGGGNSATFTPSTLLKKSSTISDLAGSLYANQMIEPTSTYNFLSENNDYATNIDYYNVLANLAENIKNRQYRLPTTTTTTDYGTSGLNDLLTSVNSTMGLLGGMQQQTSGASPGSVASGMGGILSLLI